MVFSLSLFLVCALRILLKWKIVRAFENLWVTNFKKGIQNFDKNMCASSNQEELFSDEFSNNFDETKFIQVILLFIKFTLFMCVSSCVVIPAYLILFIPQHSFIILTKQIKNTLRNQITWFEHQSTTEYHFNWRHRLKSSYCFGTVHSHLLTTSVLVRRWLLHFYFFSKIKFFILT